MAFLQIEPQKARGPFKAAKQPLDVQLKYLADSYSGDEWVGEEKYDGDRRVGQFVDGVLRLTGCRQSVKDGLFVEKTANVPHLSNWPDARIPPVVPHKTMRFLEGCVIDGEMIVPEDFVTGAGGKSKHVTSIMGSLPDEAVRKQLERGLLRYAVFDLLWAYGEDIRGQALAVRRKLLQEVLAKWNNPHAFLVPQYTGNKAPALESIWARDGEGMILKHVDHRYGQHLRWIKVKMEATADVVIIGYKEPKEVSKKVDGTLSATKYAGTGLIGSIVFGQYVEGQLRQVGSTNGMDEATRAMISKNRDKYTGAVIEIKHYGREADTLAFRHPQFRRFRNDKNPEACVFNPEEV